MSSHDQSSDAICSVNRYERLKIVINLDGTVTRLLHLPTVPADEHSSPIRSKDVPLDPARGTYVRIFAPSSAPALGNVKRPLVIYFHCGGFVYLSVSTSMNHDFCAQMASALDAVVVSVGYRLAPEHRLPAAYEDAADALQWVRTSSEAWLRDFADVSNCFLVGSSAGGNICYHAGLRADRDELAPLRIRGLVLHHAYFGGVRRTASEVRLKDDPLLSLSGNDLMWELALPVGADRDHEYSNPTAGEYEWEAIGRAGVWVLVIGCDGDPLIERQAELVAMLKQKGVEAVGEFSEGGSHAHELADSGAAQLMFDLLKDFIKLT